MLPSSRSPPCRSAMRESLGVKACTIFTRVVLCPPLRAAASSFGSVVSPHPDAVRRRQEFEALLVARETERTKDMEDARKGKSWWQADDNAPSNLVTTCDPDMLRHVLCSSSDPSDLVVINFFTEDCYTCKTLYPKIRQLANMHPHVKFLKANGTPTEMHEAFQDLDINRVPYFHLYKGGQLVDQFSASLNPEKLARLRLAVKSHA